MRVHISLTILLLTFLYNSLSAQNNEKYNYDKSYTYVYKISDNNYEKLYYSKQYNDSLFSHLVDSFPANKLNHSSLNLIVGKYIFISYKDSNKIYQFHCVNTMNAYILYGNRLMVFEKNNLNPISDAVVTINGNTIGYNDDLDCYLIDRNSYDHDLIKIKYKTETLYVKEKRDRHYGSCIKMKTFRRLLYKFKKLIYPKKHPSLNKFDCYTIYSKKYYCSRDTLKFKTYIVSKDGKKYNKPIRIILRNYDKMLIDTVINCVSKGIYQFDVVIGNYLPYGSTSIEIFNKRMTKKIYYNNIFISYKPRDAIFDLHFDNEQLFNRKIYIREPDFRKGEYNLIFKAISVNEIFDKNIFIPCILWENKFFIDSLSEIDDLVFNPELPNASFKFTYSNANDSSSYRNKTTRLYTARMIKPFIKDNSVYALFYNNGKLTESAGKLELVYNDGSCLDSLIKFPFNQKIKNNISSYKFQNSYETSQFDFNEQRYNSQDLFKCNAYIKRDSLIINFENSTRIPVYYSLTKDSKKIIDYFSDSSQCRNAFKIKNAKYKIDYSYFWGDYLIKQCTDINFYKNDFTKPFENNQSIQSDLDSTNQLIPINKERTRHTYKQSRPIGSPLDKRYYIFENKFHQFNTPPRAKIIEAKFRHHKFVCPEKMKGNLFIETSNTKQHDYISLTALDSNDSIIYYPPYTYSFFNLPPGNYKYTLHFNQQKITYNDTLIVKADGCNYSRLDTSYINQNESTSFINASNTSSKNKVNMSGYIGICNSDYLRFSTNIILLKDGIPIRSTTCNREEFMFENIDPGIYDLKVSHTGCRTKLIIGIQVLYKDTSIKAIFLNYQ